jgi:hypothetical protein
MVAVVAALEETNNHHRPKSGIANPATNPAQAKKASSAMNAADR